MTKERYCHHHAVEIPIYRGVFVVLVSNCIKKAKELIEDLEIERAVYAHSSWPYDWNDREAFVLLLNMDGPEPITHATITHEATHIANGILSERGAKPSFNNDEPFAYLVEWVANEIYKALVWLHHYDKLAPFRKEEIHLLNT